jgi:hypothetical protein
VKAAAAAAALRTKTRRGNTGRSFLDFFMA